MTLLAEFLFFDKGVIIEPFQQRAGIGGDHLALHIVQVRIDEAGHDQVRAMVDDLRIGGIDAAEILQCHDLTIGNDHRAIFEITIARRIIEALRLRYEGQHPPAQNGARHSAEPSRYHSTSNARSSGVISLTLPGGMAWA